MTWIICQTLFHQNVEIENWPQTLTTSKFPNIQYPVTPSSPLSEYNLHT